MSFGPLLTARKASVLRAMRSSPAARSRDAGRLAQAFRGKDDVRGDAKQRIVLECRPIAVEHDRHAAAARRRADRLDETPDSGYRPARCRRTPTTLSGSAGVAAAMPLVAIGHDHAIAARIDEDRRERGGEAGDALAGGAVDMFARERREARGRRWRPLRAGPPIGPASAARPPSRAMATAAFAAQPPLTTKNPSACALPSGGGNSSTRNTSSSTMMPAQRMRGAAAARARRQRRTSAPSSTKRG